MTKYKSLLFREFRQNRKTIIISIIPILSCSLLMAFTVFMLKSLPITESEEAVVDLNMAENLITQMFSLFLMLVAVLTFFDDKTFSTDLTTGWLKYSYALPISPFERSVTRILYSVILCSGALLYSLIFSGILSLLNDQKFNFGVVIMGLLIICVTLVPKIITDLFTLKARDADELKKNKSLPTFITAALMFGAAAFVAKISGFDLIAFMDPESDMTFQINWLEHLSSPLHLLWTLPLIAVLTAVHFIVIYSRMKCAYNSQPTAKTAEISDKIDLTVKKSDISGFIYKEFKQNKSEIFTVIALPYIIFAIAALVVGLLSQTPSFRNIDNWFVSTLTSHFVVKAVAAVCFFISGGYMIMTFHSDNKKLWAHFVVTTPNGIKSFLYSKFVLTFALTGMYFVSCFFLDYFAATLRWFAIGSESVPSQTFIVAMFFMLLIDNAINIPLVVRFGDKKGGAIALAGLIVLGLITLIVLLLLPEDSLYAFFDWMKNLLTGKNLNGIILTAFGMLPIAAVGSYLISYKISCKLFMKGVSEYAK